MAAGKEKEIEQTLQDMEMEITCPICHEHYTDPKMLPCFHYYCKKCIHGMAYRTGSNRPFPCPECRETTTITEEDLKPAWIANRLKSMYYKHKKALGRQETCEFCHDSGKKVKAYCKQCDKFACQACTDSHYDRQTAADEHDVVLVTRYNTTKIQEIVKEAPLMEKCSRHREALKTYCYDCHRNICGECIVDEHNGHKLESIAEAAWKMKEDLTEKLFPLRSGADSLDNAVKKIKTTKEKIETQHDSAIQTIESSFVELQAILDARRQELLKDVTREVKEKMIKLTSQEEDLSRLTKMTREVLKGMENGLQFRSDHEVTRTNSEMLEKISEQVRACEDANATSHPVETADIFVEISCLKDLDSLCKKKANISLFHAISIPETISLGKESAVEFLIREPMTSFTTTSLNVECIIKCLHNGTLVKSKTNRISPGKYQTLFKPNYRGRHELSVGINGKPVTGSCTPLVVSVSPVQLQKTTTKVCTLKHPCKIAVNSQGEIVVAERGSNIVVIDRNGKMLRKILTSEYGMERLESLALDLQDDIFFADKCSNKLGKCTRICDSVKVFETLQFHGPGYKDLVVVDDEVFVIEQNNQGQIEVFDKEFKFLRHIAARMGSKLRCLHSDKQGMLYISDNANTIQVLSTTGYLLHSIGYDVDGNKVLRTPWMVHVHAQFVYVADHHHMKTVVFNTYGEYVTMFGIYGSACMDQDGFCYLSYYHDIYRH